MHVIARRNAREGRPASLTRKLTARRQSLAAAQAVLCGIQKRQRVAQNAIAIAKVRDTLNKAIPENDQTPIALQQFIFPGAAGETSSRILTWSLQRMATGAYRTGRASYQPNLRQLAYDVQKFFYQSQALGEQRLRNLCRLTVKRPDLASCEIPEGNLRRRHREPGRKEVLRKYGGCHQSRPAEG
ncbi:hypothetical protein LNP74_19565 [Klebsiella pneumoniae subsp. pneumoniae]|nr:hypothetical protein [Klebsiella pneumoniae subsp. pneumoniae]